MKKSRTSSPSSKCSSADLPKERADRKLRGFVPVPEDYTDLPEEQRLAVAGQLARQLRRQLGRERRPEQMELALEWEDKL
jgi:hypothetical protein